MTLKDLAQLLNASTWRVLVSYRDPAVWRKQGLANFKARENRDGWQRPLFTHVPCCGVTGTFAPVCCCCMSSAQTTDSSLVPFLQRVETVKMNTTGGQNFTAHVYAFVADKPSKAKK